MRVRHRRSAGCRRRTCYGPSDHNDTRAHQYEQQLEHKRVQPALPSRCSLQMNHAQVAKRAKQAGRRKRSASSRPAKCLTHPSSLVPAVGTNLGKYIPIRLEGITTRMQHMHHLWPYHFPAGKK